MSRIAGWELNEEWRYTEDDTGQVYYDARNSDDEIVFQLYITPHLAKKGYWRVAVYDVNERAYVYTRVFYTKEKAKEAALAYMRAHGGVL